MNISAMVDMSIPTVSFRLHQLRARDGKEAYYKASDTEQTHLPFAVKKLAWQAVCKQEGHNKH